MRWWIFIWALTGLLLAAAARFLSTTPDHHLRLVTLLYPWAALWASLVAHARLPLSLARVHHVTIGSVLALAAIACAFVIANDTRALSLVTLRLFVLAGMAGALFALFGTAWAVCASAGWRRSRTTGVLGKYPPGLA